jgi:hypothetical protein
MMKDAASVVAKRVVVADERGWRCGGMTPVLLGWEREVDVLKQV